MNEEHQAIADSTEGTETEEGSVNSVPEVIDSPHEPIQPEPSEDTKICDDGVSETSEGSPKRAKKKRRRRKSAEKSETERLSGRKSLCLGVDQIAPKMMKTIKNRILIELPETPRGLNENELTQFIIRNAKKLTLPERILQEFHELETNADLRNLKEIILSVILIQEETYSLEANRLNEKVLEYEKATVKASRKLDFFDAKLHDEDRVRSCDIYNTVLEAAWRSEDHISAEEANLLLELRRKLGISSEDHRLLSAHLKKFPKHGCKMHTPNEIHDVRKELQRQGLLWSYRGESGGDVDAIPIEVAEVLRSALCLELQDVNFRRLLENDHLTVSELRKILKDHKLDPYGNKPELIERIAGSDVRPSKVLERLDRSKLSKMNSKLRLKSSGLKEDLICRLIEFYDDLSFEEKTTQDEREEWFNNYELLASRRYADLRAKKIIKKDQEIDSHFERATDFLFEKLLNLKIDSKRKVTKSDGRILLNNKQVILWDCKSCESEVNLQDFLDTQFRSYLETESSKGNLPLAFLVIAPAFTENSIKLALQFKAKTNWDIALIQADALKAIAEYWSQSDDQNKQFNAGLLNQTGHVDRAKADFLISHT